MPAALDAVLEAGQDLLSVETPTLGFGCSRHVELVVQGHVAAAAAAAASLLAFCCGSYLYVPAALGCLLVAAGFVLPAAPGCLVVAAGIGLPAAPGCLVCAAGIESPAGLVLLMLDQGTALDDLPVCSGLRIDAVIEAGPAGCAVSPQP